MAVKKLPSGRRAVEFETRGRRVFRRLPPGATKAQAEEFELQLRRELIDRTLLGKHATLRLSKVVQDWFDQVVVGRKDEISTRSKVKLVREAIGAELALTKDGIVEAARRVQAMKRDGPPYTVATINRRLSVLKGAAKWAWKIKHWTPENLSPYVVLLDQKRERVRTKTLTHPQVQQLIRQAPNFETKAFIALGFYGLMRRGEIMRARREDIGRGLTLPETKNGQTRVVPIVSQLRPYTKAIPLEHHPRTLYEWFEGARDRAGFTGLVHHDLRRSGATFLLNAGVPLEVVAHILGNSLDVARRVYARVLNPTAEKAMRKAFKMPKRKARKSHQARSPRSAKTEVNY